MGKVLWNIPPQFDLTPPRRAEVSPPYRIRVVLQLPQYIFQYQ